MLQLDGQAVRKEIVENEETKDIPVVMLTAKAQPLDKMISLHVAGVTDYITKPFGRQELVDRGKKALEEQVQQIIWQGPKMETVTIRVGG